MEPKAFKGSNFTYAKDQPQYKSLPCFKADDGTVVTCWKLSFGERLRILFSGNMWVAMLTFNKPLTPITLTTKQSDVLEIK